MEEGKVANNFAGSQDALLPTPNGYLANQTITLTMKTMYMCGVNGGMTILNMTNLLQTNFTAVVSTPQL
jgi:hypothetical protein